jgi:TolB-like protein
MGQKTSPKTISEIGRRLGVSSVMEGCLRSSRNHIPVRTQLIRGSDLTRVWTVSFDENFQSTAIAEGDCGDSSLHRASV